MGIFEEARHRLQKANVKRASRGNVTLAVALRENGEVKPL
jgi:hypothetical protein